MRGVLFLSVMLACNTPHNLVCERVAILSPKAECIPEMSGVGSSNVHTARITVEQNGSKSTVVCGVSQGQLAMACDALQVQPKPAEAPKQ